MEEFIFAMMTICVRVVVDEKVMIDEILKHSVRLHHINCSSATSTIILWK